MDLLNVLTWWIMVDLLGLIALPLCTVVLKNLWDKGYSASKIMGILLASYLSWILSYALGYTLLAVFLALAILAVISVLLLVRYDILEIVKSNSRFIIQFETVFIVAFLVFLVIRMHVPDINGAEKLMDFAFINSINRDTAPPFYDPWFSGSNMLYYYFGYFIITTLIKMTGTAPSIAFNIAVPLFFALTASAAYGVGYNLTRKVRYSMLIMLFVVVMGNLVGLIQVVNTLLGGAELSTTYYWASSRVIPDTINEFPFFSFLHGDLHAHVISIPFQLMFILLGLNVFASKRNGFKTLGDDISGVIMSLLVLSIALGVFFPVNSWDYPTYLILIVVLLGATHFRGGSFKSLLRMAPTAIFIILLSLVLFSPYYLDSHIFRGGVDVVVGRSLLHEFLAIFMLFLVPLFTLSFISVNWGFASSDRIRIALAAAFIGLVGVSFFFNLQLLWLMILLLFLSVVAVLQILFRDKIDAEDVSKQFALILAVLGGMIALMCELLYIKDGMPPPYERMNTVFKTYMHVWLFWSIAAGYGVYYVFTNKHLLEEKSKIGFTAWTLIMIFLCGACLTYPVVATYTRTDGFAGEATLDGMIYIKTIISEDEYRAMQWLNSNVSGHPVVLEKPGADYTWTSRVAANTGLPTVIGWPGHEVHWRENPGEIGKRTSDVNRIYKTTDVDEALELLKKYNVSYVYVGTLETDAYPEGQLSKFRDQPETFEPVFRRGEVAVYKISYQSENAS